MEQVFTTRMAGLLVPKTARAGIGIVPVTDS